jgi:threonylcarbamoyladenosine tRNA methylthiotransferase MtaB
MRRRYKRELYADRISEIKRLMPDCCIGVDVIVGFPGESDEDFLTTYNFLNELDVSYLHVFTYSERENTPAAEMKGKVPGAIRAERSKMLHILSEKKRRAFYATQVGRSAEILFEGDHKNGFMHGFTRNYVKVKTAYDPLLINEIRNVNLENIAADGDMEISIPTESLVH